MGVENRGVCWAGVLLRTVKGSAHAWQPFLMNVANLLGQTAAPRHHIGCCVTIFEGNI